MAMTISNYCNETGAVTTAMTNENALTDHGPDIDLIRDTGEHAGDDGACEELSSVERGAGTAVAPYARRRRFGAYLWRECGPGQGRQTAQVRV